MVPGESTLPWMSSRKTLNAKLRGHYQYYGPTDKLPEYLAFFREVRAHLGKSGSVGALRETG